MRAVEIRLKGDDLRLNLRFRLKLVGFRESFGLQGQGFRVRAGV